MIKALIFDFDGLILETEEPEFLAWQEIYAEHGGALPFERWSSLIGTADAVFDVYAELETQHGSPVDREAIRQRRRQRVADLIATRTILPGVRDYIATARELGLKIGVASSSRREWVCGHLERLAIHAHFDAIICSDDVARTKPDPALYLTALTALGAAPHEAIALEDSPNGVAAARRAGIFCVAVPNALTRQLPLEEADLRLASLAEMPLETLLAYVEARHRSGAASSG